MTCGHVGILVDVVVVSVKSFLVVQSCGRSPVLARTSQCSAATADAVRLVVCWRNLKLVYLLDLQVLWFWRFMGIRLIKDQIQKDFRCKKIRNEVRGFQLKRIEYDSTKAERPRRLKIGFKTHFRPISNNFLLYNGLPWQSLTNSCSKARTTPRHIYTTPYIHRYL